MADNVTLPATDTGTADIVVATDKIGGVDFQRVKLAVGDDGAAADVKSGAGVAAGSLRVELPTDGTGRVNVMQPIVRISQTPTVSTSPAYAAKDCVGGLLTFANAARASGGAIEIESLAVVDLSATMPLLDLVLFDRTFTAGTDNAALDISDADALNVIAVIPISVWADFADNSIASRLGLGLGCKLNGTDLFGQLVARSAVTLAGTADITVILGIRQVN